MRLTCNYENVCLKGGKLVLCPPPPFEFRSGAVYDRTTTAQPESY